MCGISGIYNFNQKIVEQKELNLLNSRMEFRGPDDQGYYLADHFGMCMRRLSIIDVNNGKQPISYEKNDLHVILNGEIYNYIELRDQLKQKNYVFKTNSDTEVLLYLYTEYGENFINYINGIFSFVIYDNKHKKLLIYRDRLGVKPLYYYLDKKKLIFSSNLDSISKLIRNNEIDYYSLFSYLINNYVPGQNSINNHVKKLLPGSFISVENNNLKIKSYWKIKNINKNRLDNFDEQFENTLTDTIKIQSRTDVKIGTFLSGGVDSSVISYLLSKRVKNFDTYTTNFIGKNQEDLYFSKKISEELHLQNKILNIDLLTDFEKYIDELLYYLDEPISDTAIIPTFLLSKLAKRNNTKVIMTGAGGDELFGGYARHYPKQKIRSYFPNININLILILATILKKDFINIFIKIFNNEIDFMLGASGASFNLLNCLVKNRNIFHNTFKKNVHYQNINSYSFSSQKDLLKIDMMNYLPDNILSLTDKMSMSSSIEARVPFLDHRLIELVVGQDDDKFYGKNINCSKTILKNLYKDQIKTKIWNRKKEGFNAPSNQWIFNNKLYLIRYFKDAMHPVLNDIIDKDLLWKKILRINNKNDRNIHSLFSLFLLNKWLIKRNA